MYRSCSPYCHLVYERVKSLPKIKIYYFSPYRENRLHWQGTFWEKTHANSLILLSTGYLLKKIRWLFNSNFFPYKFKISYLLQRGKERTQESLHVDTVFALFTAFLNLDCPPNVLQCNHYLLRRCFSHFTLCCRASFNKLQLVLKYLLSYRISL